MSDAAGPSGSTQSAQSDKASRLERLRALQMRKSEASRLNHREVVEEDRKAKLPKNFEEKQYWAQYALDEEKKAAKAKEEGRDYEMEKLRNVSAEEADRLERAKRKKRNPDQGFSSFEAATARQYHSLVDQIKPDMDDYQAKKEKMGVNFFPTADTMIHGMHKDSPEALERLSKATHQIAAKREKFSRRRRFDPDADIDFINERNQRFNKKLERFYGEYTKETKLNLERGTAL